MRTIKFRAWCEGKHGNLTFGKAHMEYGVSIGGKGGYLDIESGWDIHGEYLTVPLMQYTELKDCKGIEIYEGDILKNVSPAVVSFQKGAFVVGEYGVKLDKFSGDTKEIIGNIFEDKELIRRKRYKGKNK